MSATTTLPKNIWRDHLQPRWRLWRRGRGAGALACNICFWQGGFLQRHSSAHEKHCPRCKSANRHRLIAWYLQEKGWLRPGLAVLHVAPEPTLGALIAAAVGEGYESCDLERRDVDHRLDLQYAVVAPAKFDLVIANHVLEHVPEDRAALANLARMLAPGGVCVVSVPMSGGAATDEDPAVVNRDTRRRRFGQEDHVRLYGMDLAERMAEAGMQVALLRSQDVPGDVAARFGMEGEVVFLGHRGP